MPLNTEGLEQWERAFRREILPFLRSAKLAVAIDGGQTGHSAEQRLRRNEFC
jgi:hypothetical protein